MKQEVIDLLIEDLNNEALINEESKIDFHDYYKFRVSYITVKKNNLMFLFVSSLTDKFENIQKELIRCKNEFLNLFEDILQHHFDAKTYEVFDPTIDSIHRNLRPKISLVGFSGVGKTTITKLIKADEIPMQHIPTITGDIATIKIGKLHFHLWDFAGQEQFSYLWNNFIKGSDAVLLITNSTLENVEKSKYFLELINQQAPNAQTAVIGNKQDLKGALSAVQIEKVLGLKAYSMIALDPSNRDKMIQIIADILEMSAEVSPLLKPLLERDKFIEDAVIALKSADFDKAAFLFDKISDLCVELGDDSLGKEFFEKSQKIKEMLKKVGAPPPISISPIERDEEIHLKSIKTLETEQSTLKHKSISYKSPLPPKLPPYESSSTLEQKVKIKKVVKREISDDDKNSKTKDLSLGADIKQENVALKLKPEDFMIRARPKSVTFVPEDAKTKLKMTATNHVKIEPELKAHIAVSPLKLMKKKNGLHSTQSKISTSPKPTLDSGIRKALKKYVKMSAKQFVENISSKYMSTDGQSGIDIKQTKIKPLFSETEGKTKLKKIQSEISPEESQQKKNLKESLLDLKIRKSHLTKMMLNFEMQELKGEITADELNDKSEKIKIMMNKIDLEIHDLENLLKE
ncbi:MAG: ADP-ribosylation factor-like protein [Candidatus Thorarchaeota archaeon]